MFDSNPSKFDTVNSEEVIAQAVRTLKQFIEKRIQVVTDTKIEETKSKKGEDNGKDHEAFLLNKGHKAGYLQALKDVQTFSRTIGM